MGMHATSRVSVHHSMMRNQSTKTSVDDLPNVGWTERRVSRREAHQNIAHTRARRFCHRFRQWITLIAHETAI
jgi:hypothetical protein